MSAIRFGFANLSVDPELAVQLGTLAEKNGFDFLWVPDHLTDVDGDRVDPWTVLAAVSAQTKKIMLASAVTDTQRIHPAKTAHMVACLDVISRGRAVLGIGAGEAMNIIPFGLPWESPSERVSRLEEAVKVIKLLWETSRDRPANFSGSYYTLTQAFLSQSPQRKPNPPIYVGAFSSRRALELIGKYAEGWYGWINTPQSFKKKMAIIETAAKSSGRLINDVDLSSHVLVAFPRNTDEKKAAMLSAKVTLLLEKKTLESLGYSGFEQVTHYQDLVVSSEYIKKVLLTAETISDEAVYKTMAPGGIDEAIALIDSLQDVGVNHFAVGDLLAPKGTRRTLEIFAKIIKRYRQ
jgi:phthiodiolone/phenolphthiodiolone dimycocerosates ketoreductase